MLKLSPEYELFLGCLAVRPPAAQERQVRDPESVDWQHLLWLASWHRLSGVLRAALGGSPGLDVVPARVFESLDERCEASRASYQRHQAELVKILDALDSEAIPVILLKGLALAEPVYGDPGLRPMGDLDLMVPEPCLDRVYQLVREMGFQPLEGRAQQERSRRLGRHYPRLRSADGRCDVEVHRHIVDLFGPIRLPVERLWDRARRGRVAGREVRVLAPADLLAQLGISFFLDRLLFYQSNSSLGQLFDMAMAVRHYRSEIEWEVLVADALAYGHAGVVHTALWTAKTLLGAEIPNDALARLASGGSSPRRLERFAERKVLEVRPWFFHQLVTVGDDQPSRWARSVVRRLLFDRWYLAQKYARPEGIPGPGHLFLRHLLDLLLLVKRYALRPDQLALELRVDRWMLSLLGDPGGRPPGWADGDGRP